MRHDQWLKTAQRLAKQSKFWPYRMGCVIVRSGKVISTGVNKNTRAEGRDPRYTLGRSIHAELAAVLSTSNLKGCTAYVAGWSKADNLICSKPCSLCEGTLKQAGIKEVYYQTKEGTTTCIVL